MVFSVNSPVCMPTNKTGKLNEPYTPWRVEHLQCSRRRTSQVIFGARLYSLWCIFGITLNPFPYPPRLTPYEIVNGKKPDLSHIRVLGSRCWACIPLELQTKFGPHSHCAIFLGYPDGTKGYHVRDAENSSFFTARDVIFEEKLPALINTADVKQSKRSQCQLRL